VAGVGPCYSTRCYTVSRPGHRREQAVSPWLIILTGVIYGYIAVEQFFKGNPQMTVVYAGYAFSNVGLYMMAR